MPLTLLNKGNHPATKFHRMCSAHSDPLHLVRSENHKTLNLRILNQMGCDTPL